MKVTYQWLREFVDFDFTPAELADRLTMLGLEVDSFETIHGDYRGATVGEVISVANGEAVVDTGGEKLRCEIAGAKIGAGERVVVIPGEKSGHGSLATYSDLGISEDESPIFIGDAYPVGTAVSSILPEEDTVYDIDLTPNRADCFSVMGIAREISAITGNELKIPEIQLKEADPPASEFIKVEIETPEGCPRYAGRVLRGVQIQPSPLWMHDRLYKIGLRAINNVVDVTNYVMMETGHPLHAFDYSLIAGHKIVVRLSKHGERFVTLDGKGHTLDDQTVLICDAVRPVALGGIMGGLNSEVRDTTRDLLLECAYFEPRYIRRSASRLGIATESSIRFSRGVDPNDTLRVIDRTAQLIQQLAGGTVQRGAVDAYVRKIFPVSITLRTKRVEQVLGAQVPVERIQQVLSRLGCQVSGSDSAAGEEIHVVAPTFRPDLTREIDLIEEIARVIGYDQVPEKPDTAFTIDPRVNRKEQFLNQARNYWIGNGFFEAVSNSMIPSGDVSLGAYPGKTLRLLNPLSEDMAILRPSLVPSLLRMAQYNLFRQQENIRLFEIGSVFLTDGEAHEEQLHLGGVAIGDALPEHWSYSNRPLSFYDLKGLLEGFVQAFKLEDVNFREEPHWALHEPAVALISGEKKLGIFGPVRTDLLQKYDIPLSVFIFELNLNEFLPIIKWERFLKPIPRFPWVRRDLAFVVDLNVSGGSLLEEVKKWGGTILREINIFDVYTGKQVPAGKKSIAVAMKFQADDRTLTEEEISEAVQRIIEKVKAKFGAELRQ